MLYICLALSLNGEEEEEIGTILCAEHGYMLVDLITSTTEGKGGYVFTPFCLFVCVQDISKLWTGWVCGKDKLITFW